MILLLCHVGVPYPPTLQLSRNYLLLNETILSFSIYPPINIDEIDLDFYEITIKMIDFNETSRWTNDTTSFTLRVPHPTGVASAMVNAVAVDRCRQRSEPISMIGM